MHEIDRLEEVASQFDAFFVDQFGVLLDGTKPYPGAAEALSALAATGKPIILLSNSGKRGEANAKRLARLGFERSAFLEVLSSGEVAFGELTAAIGTSLPPRPRIWLHARDNDISAIEGLPVELVERPENADLLLLSASIAERIDLSDYIEFLRPASERNIPCWCTNPDLVMLTASGPKAGAGRIAHEYQALGGAVTFFGKPYPLIYHHAEARLGLKNARILCIGDSIEHDIAGGFNAGHSTCLVGTGVDADHSAQQITMRAQGSNLTINYYLKSFQY